MHLSLDPEERHELAELADIALTALSLVFLGLLLAEFALTLSPEQSRWLSLAGWVIWVVFTTDFVVRFALAESKTRYLRANWLTALAVALPAFRVFRIFRAVRAVRSLRLARLVTGTNRGARALRRVAGFAGVGYAAILTVVVWLLAAAGISWLERGRPDAAISSFPEGLWWAATTITTLGSQNHPVTPEGRVLAVLVMIFGLAISGYITATLAAFLLGRRRQQDGADAASLQAEIRALREQLSASGLPHPAPQSPSAPANDSRYPPP